MFRARNATASTSSASVVATATASAGSGTDLSIGRSNANFLKAKSGGGGSGPSSRKSSIASNTGSGSGAGAAAAMRTMGAATTGQRSAQSSFCYPRQSVVPNVRTLLVLFPTLDEFGAERELLRNSVIPEVQMFCSERDIDLEICTLYETSDLIENVEQYALLLQLLADNPKNTHVLSFIGDKYGELMLPLELSTDQFLAIQSAALEVSADVKLLEQFYVLDRNWGVADGKLYRLKPLMCRDPDAALRLCKLMQKSLRKMTGDGGVKKTSKNKAATVTVDDESLLMRSFIESAVDALLGNRPQNHVFVTRKLQGYQSSVSSNSNNNSTQTDRFVDTTKVGLERIAALKNRITVKFTQKSADECGGSGRVVPPSNNHLPFIFNLSNLNTASWLKSKEFASYGRQLAVKLTDRLRQLMVEEDESVVTGTAVVGSNQLAPPLLIGLHPLPAAASFFSSTSSTGSSVYAAAGLEHETHLAALSASTPNKWVPRAAVDSRLNDVVERIFAAANANVVPGTAGASNSIYVQFFGGAGSGKTAAMCRLHQMIAERSAASAARRLASTGGASIDGGGPAALEATVNGSAGDRGTAECIVISRFASLTKCSMFANELFYNVFLQACELNNAANASTGDRRIQPSTAQLESFHLQAVLAQAKQLLRSFERHLVLLIDDAHLLRFGGVLGRVERTLNEASGGNAFAAALFSRLHIVLFSANAAPLHGLAARAELIELPPAPSHDETLAILKVLCKQRRFAAAGGVGTGGAQQQLYQEHLSVLRQSISTAASASSTTATGAASSSPTAAATSNHHNHSQVGGLLHTHPISAHHFTAIPSALLLGEVQCDELLAGQYAVSADLGVRLSLVETRCGAENVRIVCQLLACCAPFGITRLELIDAFRLRKRTAGMSFEPEGVLSPAPLLVLKHLGSLLRVLRVDVRQLWTFRHVSIGNFVRQRYLQSVGEMKLMNEVLATLMRYPPPVPQYYDADASAAETADGASAAVAATDPSTALTTDALAACALFPQPINRENGAVNVRRVRFHWYYLLFTGDIESLKSLALCSFEYLEAAFRGCGLAHLLSIFEECLQQILDHDLLVIFEQVILPAVPTLVRDPRQFVSEFLNRLRYTRAKNSPHLNNVVEQAMQWTDNYADGPLLVPLTCWIAPPKMKQVLSFTIPDWSSSKTVIQPTFNHQHLLVAGNDVASGIVCMYHIASQILVRTFNGHECRVSSICTSHDGQFFVSTAHDGTIKVWNFTQADECIKTLRASSARILCSLISADDKWIVTGSSDSTARLISIESGACLRSFRDHTGPVVGLQLSSDNELLVTGSGDFVVMVWDIERAAIIVKMGGLMAPVTCLAITSNDAFLAVACEDETLRVFSMVSSQELHELSGHDSRVNALAASSDDCQLFAATCGKILIYDIHNGQLLEVLHCQLANLPVISLKISDDNSFVLAACGDRVHMWNMNSIERDALQNDKSTLACICMSPDERGAGCGTVDGILAFWDLDVCQCLWTTAQQKSGAVTAIDFTVDSMYLLSGSVQGGIAMWEASNGQLIRQLQVHGNGLEVASICCFADGMRVLSVDRSSQSHVWSLGSFVDENGGGGGGQSATTFFGGGGGGGPMTASASAMIMSGGGGQVNCAASAGGMMIVGGYYGDGGGGGASGGSGGGVSGQLLTDEELLATIGDMRAPIFVRYSPEIDCFVVIGQHSRNFKEVDIWSVSAESRVALKSKAHHNQEIHCFHVNKCGSTLVTGSLDLSLKVWRTDTGFLTQVLVGHTDVITCCCVTEDGRVVASGGRDRQIIVWDVLTGTVRMAIGTAQPLSSIDVCLDGSVIVSADKSGWIESWASDSGELLSSFNTHRRVQQLLMGVDGNRLLAKLSQTAQLPIFCLHNTPAGISLPSASIAAASGAPPQQLPRHTTTASGSSDNQHPQHRKISKRLQSSPSFTSNASYHIGGTDSKKGSNATDDGGLNGGLRPGSSLSVRSANAVPPPSARRGAGRNDTATNLFNNNTNNGTDGGARGKRSVVSIAAAEPSNASLKSGGGGKRSGGAASCSGNSGSGTIRRSTMCSLL